MILQDLRKGNWVKIAPSSIADSNITNDATMPMQVFGIGGAGEVFFDNNQVVVSIDQVSPIEITSDILETMGFKKTTADAASIGEYDWWENENGREVIQVFDGMYTISDTTCRPYNYVHEFQNFYYFLTGQELDFKL
jgi:hypothetical protein